MSRLTIVGIGGAWDQLLQKNFEQAGFEVSQLSPSHDLVVSISEMRSSLVLFAPNTPKAIVFEACRNLRFHRDTTTVGLIILGEQFAVEDRIEGMHAGADDCLPITTSMNELIARLASIRRRTSREGEESILQSGEVRLDRKSRLVTRNGKKVSLGPIEYRLLEELMSNKGHAVERQVLLSKGWPGASVVDDGNRLNVYITSLRRALSCQHGRKFIRAVRGVGYRFDADD